MPNPLSSGLLIIVNAHSVLTLVEQNIINKRWNREYAYICSRLLINAVFTSSFIQVYFWIIVLLLNELVCVCVMNIYKNKIYKLNDFMKLN